MSTATPTLSGPIKQMAFGRRRPGLTRQEFHDYRYHVHGGLTVGPSDAETPLRYYQTQLFDSAYHPAETGRPGPKNFNHPWAFYDDVTELYFEDQKHVLSVFGSEHVKTKVGPDAVKFADFGAANALFCREEKVSGSEESEEGLVAVYVLEAVEYHDEGTAFMMKMAEVWNDVVKTCQAQPAFKRIVLSARTPDSHDLLKYFGVAPDKPKFAGVLVLHLSSPDAVAVTRKVQKGFEAHQQTQGVLKLENTFIAFGKRVRVHDPSQGPGPAEAKSENVSK